MGAFAAPSGSPKTGSDSVKSGLAVSVLFHLFVFVGIPLLLQNRSRTASFQRPPTFQLVAPPEKMRPLTTATPNSAARQAVAKRAVPAQSSKPVPVEKPEPAAAEEETDELASLLEELPAPVQVSAAGDFKYNWYLDALYGKIARFWNPLTENRSLAVAVSFTIFSTGAISQPVIEKSSGDRTLDNLALRAVALAAPFGRLPPGFSRDRLDLSCTLIPMRN
jgi:TonB family protein